MDKGESQRTTELRTVLINGLRTNKLTLADLELLSKLGLAEAKEITNCREECRIWDLRLDQYDQALIFEWLQSVCMTLFDHFPADLPNRESFTDYVYKLQKRGLHEKERSLPIELERDFDLLSEESYRNYFSHSYSVQFIVLLISVVTQEFDHALTAISENLADPDFCNQLNNNSARKLERKLMVGFAMKMLRKRIPEAATIQLENT